MYNREVCKDLLNSCDLIAVQILKTCIEMNDLRKKKGSIHAQKEFVPGFVGYSRSYWSKILKKNVIYKITILEENSIRRTYM